MSIAVFDNFLEEENFKELQTLLLGGWFPWYFNDGIASVNTDSVYDYQFTHTFVRDGEVSSDWMSYLDCIIQKIKPKTILRVKANLLTASKEIIESDFHTDVEDTTKSKTAILYINTNDGYTIFKDGTRISSIENRFVVFDSNIIHKGTNCTNQKSRCVINFNFIENNNEN
jgi:hypothetical protein